MELEKVHRRYTRLKHQVQQKLAKLQQQRLDQLMPSSINTPAPWQHIEIKKTAVMYKVMAAQDGGFCSVYDPAVRYTFQQWTHARYGCGLAWPPLWSCMYVFPDRNQALAAVFPRASQQKHGARVLVKVQVRGKGYAHPDGRIAVSAVYMDEVLEYVPVGPAEKVVKVLYQ